MDDFLSETKNISNIMYDTAAEFNGSFSAEHGVGVYKKNELEIYKSKVELSLMKTLKRSIDVNNIMNPNKVV
jgi:FAD/FMN-containing dehydrogenase